MEREKGAVGLKYNLKWRQAYRGEKRKEKGELGWRDEGKNKGHTHKPRYLTGPFSPQPCLPLLPTIHCYYYSLHLYPPHEQFKHKIPNTPRTSWVCAGGISGWNDYIRTNSFSTLVSQLQFKCSCCASWGLNIVSIAVLQLLHYYV